MSKIVDSVLSGIGKSLLFVANVFRYLWHHTSRWRSRPDWWARMALTDGHGKMRNWPCFCRSGLKLKRCCGATAQQKQFWARQRALAVERHLDHLRVKNIGSIQA